MKIGNKESHQFADIFPMIEGEQLNQLKEDIKEHGCLEPIVLFEGKILDGRNRYKACYELGIKPKEEQYTGTKPLEYVISLNLKRRHLNESQRAMIAEKLTNTMHGGDRSKSSIELLVTDEKASKLMNISIAHIKRAREIERKAPEKVHEIEQGKTKVGAVYRIIKLAEQKKHIETNLAKTKIEGTFDVIVVDPPWSFRMEYDPEVARGAGDYPTMTQEEIKNIVLPIKKDCVVWLWGVDCQIQEALDVIKAWGLERKATLIWDKQIMGLGATLRMQHEYCFLCFKGKPYFNGKNTRSVLTEKRTSHSTKPEGFYKLVEETCAGRKLDYFARKKRKDWEVYGDEVEK